MKPRYITEIAKASIVYTCTQSLERCGSVSNLRELHNRLRVRNEARLMAKMPDLSVLVPAKQHYFYYCSYLFLLLFLLLPTDSEEKLDGCTRVSDRAVVILISSRSETALKRQAKGL